MNDETQRPGGDTKATLIAASGALAEALRSGDAAALETMTATGFTFIDANGAIRQAVPGGSFGGTEFQGRTASWRVSDYGTIAMVVGRSPADGGEFVAMDVWVKDGTAWRALIHHLNLVADPAAPPAHPAPVPRAPQEPAPDCENPCSFVPYQPKEEAERDIIASFQVMEKAVTRNDADEWVKHMADEFIVFRTRQRPTTKAERAEHLRNQQAVNAETFVAAVERMNLWVFGDAALMRADHVMPGNRRPPYRATRVWVKRDGRWQMAASQQTTRAG